MKTEERSFILENLKQLLSDYGIPDFYYSFSLDYLEGGVCLKEDSSDSFIVYDCERNKKRSITPCTSLIDACYEIISRFSVSVKDEQILKSKFNNLIKDYL